MAAYKVNVSLPRELVGEIDAAAAECRMTRSAFVAEASARYIAEREREKAEERRKVDIDHAIEHMREIGRKIPKDFDYMKVIREFRERDGWDRP